MTPTIAGLSLGMRRDQVEAIHGIPFTAGLYENGEVQAVYDFGIVIFDASGEVRYLFGKAMEIAGQEFAEGGHSDDLDRAAERVQTVPTEAGYVLVYRCGNELLRAKALPSEDGLKLVFFWLGEKNPDPSKLIGQSINTDA